MERLPLADPAVVGVNVMVTAELFPAASVRGSAGPVAILKTAPVTLIWETVMLAPPAAAVLLKVTVLVLLLPIATDPKFTAVGVTASAPAGEGAGAGTGVGDGEADCEPEEAAPELPQPTVAAIDMTEMTKTRRRARYLYCGKKRYSC